MKKKSTILKEKRNELHRLQEDYRIALFWVKSNMEHMVRLSKQIKRLAKEMRDLQL